MQKVHAIFGFRYQGKYYLALSDVEGWPDILGKKMAQIIKSNNNTCLIEISRNLKLTENDFMLNAEYKYIINLDNLTLEYYCQNKTPRAIFTLDQLRKTDTNQIVRIMESLDEKNSSMYNLFMMEASQEKLWIIKN